MKIAGTMRLSAVAAVLLTALAAMVLSAETVPAKPRLAVVSTPTGLGFEAKVGEALIPDDVRGRYQVVPLLDLVAVRKEEYGSIPDGGADGGDQDPKEATAERAREAALAFDLVLAAELWRKAAEEVMGSEAVVMDLPLAASYLLEAGAACAAAGEADLARVYFRRALGMTLDIRPGPEISPDAKSLFKDALAEGPLVFEAPRDSILESICDSLHVDGLVWIAVGNDKDALSISFKVFRKGSATSEVETRQYRTADRGVMPEWIEDEHERLSFLLALKLLGKDLTRRDGVEGDSKADKPWYRKWWFFTAVGSVLVGTAAGLTSYFVLREEEVDVVVHP